MSTEEPAPEEEDEDFRYFVRIHQTDLDGTKTVERALTEMNGIGRRSARLIADSAGIGYTETLGALSDEVIESLVEEVTSFGDDQPEWLANHQAPFYSGDTSHEIGNELDLTRDQDINRLKMIRSYRGIRHERGQKVRGQRTKSTGRSEGTIGVNVERIQEEAEAEAEDEGGPEQTTEL